MPAAQKIILMELFKFYEDDVLTPDLIHDFKYPKEIIRPDDLPQLDIPDEGTRGGNEDQPRGVFTQAVTHEVDLSNQFFIFQLGSKASMPALQESSEISPLIKGSEESPDVVVNLELQSFHVAASEDIDRNTRATMRINIGKDRNSQDRFFDQVYWSIATGLNLYNEYKKKPASPRELKADFKSALGRRPIEIPGGLSTLSFEVIKHRASKWWQKIFQFVNSGTGSALSTTLGFPAIGLPAIRMLDEVLNRLDRNKPRVLFKSMPMRLALSQLAKEDYQANNERVRVGCLNPGYSILARGKDFPIFNETNAVYYPAYGRVVPGDINRSDLISGNYTDPFLDVTYAVLKVDMRSVKLDPTFGL